MWQRSSFFLGLALGVCVAAAAMQWIPAPSAPWGARLVGAADLEGAAVSQQTGENSRSAGPSANQGSPPPNVPPEDGKLRIICFGAHPDDCELKAGGMAARWAAAGHHVKFVSVTNGDIGHWRDAGGPLAARRAAEVTEAARILRITTEVLDIHDGELEPNLANRKTITRLIREWNADLVLGPRPNDYHPDHRYTGVLVQDAAYMVMVPFICPDVPPLKKNPVFLFYSDRFEKPTPFEADIAIGIDAVMDQKLDALDVIVSQFQEGGALGSAELLPDSEEGQAARRREVRAGHARRFDAQPFRAALMKWYGADQGGKIAYSEAFEVCEYGRQPSDDELGKLFLIESE